MAWSLLRLILVFSSLDDDMYIDEHLKRHILDAGAISQQVIDTNEDRNNTKNIGSIISQLSIERKTETYRVRRQL